MQPEAIDEVRPVEPVVEEVKVEAPVIVEKVAEPLRVEVEIKDDKESLDFLSFK